MNYEETLKLIDAGFSADEIRQMAATDELSKENPGASDESGKESQVHESEIKTVPAESPEVIKLTEEIKKLNETVKMLQEGNIKNARSGSSPKSAIDDPVKEQIDSFLKQL